MSLFIAIILIGAVIIVLLAMQIHRLGNIQFEVEQLNREVRYANVKRDAP